MVWKQPTLRINPKLVDFPLNFFYRTAMKIFHAAYNSKASVLLVAFGLVFGSAALAVGAINTPEDGYNFCVNNTTKVVSFPAASKCPKGSTSLILGIKGQDGAAGLTGATGLNGRDGKDGKTLWNGTKDPENNWGAPGDMYINATTRTLFGPKNLDGTWPVGVSMYGPKGDQGPAGPAGVAGATGPAGVAGATGPAGPAGVAGATGPAGAAGATGPAGAASAGGGGPLYIASASSGFLDTTATRVARLNLPAGTYLLNLNVYTYAQFGSGPITCRIDATTTDTSDAITISSSVNQGRGMMGRSQSITLVTQRDVDANCFSLNGGTSSMLGLIIMGGTFTAVQVSSVITQ
jgi:hypothetical protein